MPNSKEIEALKRRLKKQEEKDIELRGRDARIAAYARKSNAKIAKSQKKSGKKRDVYAAGHRAPGSGFSRKG